MNGMRSSWRTTTAALLALGLSAAGAAQAQQRPPLWSCGVRCLPPDWDLAWTDRNDGHATPYVLELAERLNAAMFGNTTYAGRKVHVGDHGGYLARNYRNFATPVPGGFYMRHAGMDFWRAEGVAVRSITAGVVTRILYVPGRTGDNVVEVREKKDGRFRNRWWNYGHMRPDASIHEGKQVFVGTRLGAVDFQGKAPHVHLSVHTRESSTPPTAGLKPAQHLGWGRGYSTVSGPDAESVAKLYTDHPLRSYAIAMNLPY